ncbi:MULTISPECIES: hypothetical protein [Pseudomonas]|uniref:hypothetical protein n=1 Tax=Pseudomonas TaxID=286 RepID=UPI001C492976|nr:MULTISPECIES: hypothetical protein [Pseudomonas]MDR9862746.1 hypothetical protein [Pseudomonas baetica]
MNHRLTLRAPPPMPETFRMQPTRTLKRISPVFAGFLKDQRHVNGIDITFDPDFRSKDRSLVSLDSA